MNKELCDKLNALPIEDRKKYCAELETVFTDHVYAQRTYGLSREEYNNPSQEIKEKFEEIIYKKMFANNDK
jgi:hypothetical protein